MDNRRFDAFTKTLTTSDSPRRTILQVLGASALAAVVGRFAGEDAEAKKKRKNKKKKKCKGNTRKCNGKCIPADNCCVDGDCDIKETCDGGQCIDVVGVDCQSDADCRGAAQICQDGECVVQQECQDADDCAANEICFQGACRCAFPNKPCGEACCPENQVCFDGQCVFGEGTCAATDDVCVAGFFLTCDDNPNCFCGQRPDGGVHCFGGFLNDSRDNCTCIDDADCERDFGAGTICIKGGSECQCQDTDSGRCARLCPTL